MDLNFTPEEQDFRTRAREFAEHVIAPEVESIEGTDEGALGEYPRELIRRMAEEGFIGPMLPRQYGGSEMGVVGEAIVAEEFSAVSPATDMSREVTSSFFTKPLVRYGTEEQKEKYLLAITRGEIIGAIGITEPEVGSDISGMKTMAVKDGNKWVINGEKRFITNGNVADVICLFAITDPNVKPKYGVSAFLVHTDRPGFVRIKDFKLAGMHGARVGHFRLEDYRIPSTHILGAEGQGFEIVLDELNSERIILAAGALGYARTPLEIAINHSNERIQFGRRIRDFEGVSFPLADMATRLEAARLLTYHAARTHDAGKPVTMEAAMAKFFTCDTAVDITNRSLQICGGIGYTKEYPVERFWRDARVMQIGGGTREIMQFIISRELFKQYGL
jgi:alkylation response protein AidB-like acyl-CoA dehydrogenase